MNRRELELLSLKALRQLARERGEPQAGRKSRKALLEALLEPSEPSVGQADAGAVGQADAVEQADAGGVEQADAGAAGKPAGGGPGQLEAPVRREPLPVAEAGAAGKPAGRGPGQLEAPLQSEPLLAAGAEPQAEGTGESKPLVAADAEPQAEGTGESKQLETAGQEAAIPPEAVAGEQSDPPQMFIDRGPPLPPRTDTNYLDVLVKDPWTIAALWELSDATRNSPISDGSGRAFLASRWSLRILGHRGEILASPEVGWMGDWWVTVPAETAGIACLGAESPSGRFCPVLWSQPFNTPRAAPAPDRTVRWLRVELRREEAPAETLVRKAPEVPAAPGGDLRLFGLSATGLELPAPVGRLEARGAGRAAEAIGAVPAGSGMPGVPDQADRGGPPYSSTLPAPAEEGVSTSYPTVSPGGWDSGMRQAEAGQTGTPDAAPAPTREAESASGSTGDSAPGAGRGGWRVQPAEAGPVSAEQVEALGGFELPVGLAQGSSERLLRDRFSP